MKFIPKNGIKALAAVVAGAAMLAASSGGLRAQEYPSQDIRLICPFPPGSGADVLVRFFAEKLRPIVNRTIIVENRPGAGGAIANQYVAQSKPDGHTLYVFAASSVAASMSLFKNPTVDVGKALRVAAAINRQPFMLLVDAKSPYKTVADLTEAMKKKGDKASYATAAIPGTVMGELYKQGTGIQAVEVVYKSAPDSLNEMTSGKIDYGMHDPVFALAQHREGRLRILAVSTGERLDALPDIPTMKESGVPMDLTIWWSVIVPSATPDPIVNKINEIFTKIVSDPEVKKQLNNFGGDPLILKPDEANARFLKSIEEWREYVKTAKIPQQ